MFMLGLSETMGQLAIANSVHWYSDVLRREDGHVLRRTLDFEVEGQRKKGKPKMTWKKRVPVFHWRSTTSLTTLPTLPDARSHLLPLI